MLDSGIDDDVMVARRRDVLWRVGPGHLVIATIDDAVHEATGAATEIWRAIDRPITIGELVTLLAESHALAPQEIREDVVTFLAELVAAGLIEMTYGLPMNA